MFDVPVILAVCEDDDMHDVSVVSAVPEDDYIIMCL